MLGHAELPWTAFAEHYMGMLVQQEKRCWTEADPFALRLAEYFEHISPEDE